MVKIVKIGQKWQKWQKCEKCQLFWPKSIGKNVSKKEDEGGSGIGMNAMEVDIKVNST